MSKLLIPWWMTVKNRALYEDLVKSGMAWEFHPDLPSSWGLCEEFLKKRNYCDSVKGSNYEASCKLDS